MCVCVYLEQAVELTEMAKGKHHLGDFLPPQELDKFIEKAKAIKEGRDPGEVLSWAAHLFHTCCLPLDLSDYREHKLTEENLGFRMLQKAGWDEGEGLGGNQDGITAPINK